MAHIKSVSDAIQDVLSNIKCLRALVIDIQNPETNNAAAVYTTLHGFFPGVTLNPAEQQGFYGSLRDGMMTMNAETLVDYYDSLSGTARTGKGKPQEWTP